MKNIVPNLWFDTQAEEAVEFYMSTFQDSRILGVMRYGKASSEASGRPEGSVMTISFLLAGQEFIAINGGPLFSFTPAISFMVNCETQEELDRVWGRLVEGGAAERCGWLRDKYGISWQIVPKMLDELVSRGDPVATERMMTAMLSMVKLDMAGLRAAYDGP